MRFPGEVEALEQVRTICDEYGYGNVMSFVATAYAVKHGDSAHTSGPCIGSYRSRDLRDGLHALEEIDRLRAQLKA